MRYLMVGGEGGEEGSTGVDGLLVVGVFRRDDVFSSHSKTSGFLGTTVMLYHAPNLAL